jgi:hypothetical protein
VLSDKLPKPTACRRIQRSQQGPTTGRRLGRLNAAMIPRWVRATRLALDLPRKRQRLKLRCGVAATLVLILSLGCEGRQSTAQRLEKAYQSAGMERVTVYPLGGTITVDHEPPVNKSETARFVAIAYDSAKPDAKSRSNAYSFVKADGSFDLPSLPPGKYVMLFAQLSYNPRMGFVGSDGLKNLYNDPDVNSKKSEFLVDHQAPGKTDYMFNLSVASEAPLATPGPKAFVGTGPRPAPVQK